MQHDAYTDVEPQGVFDQFVALLGPHVSDNE
jgi:hypothetical protein